MAYGFRLHIRQTTVRHYNNGGDYSFGNNNSNSFNMGGRGGPCDNFSNGGFGNGCCDEGFSNGRGNGFGNFCGNMFNNFRNGAGNMFRGMGMHFGFRGSRGGDGAVQNGIAGAGIGALATAFLGGNAGENAAWGGLAGFLGTKLGLFK